MLTSPLLTCVADRLALCECWLHFLSEAVVKSEGSLEKDCGNQISPIRSDAEKGMLLDTLSAVRVTLKRSVLGPGLRSH